MKSLFVGSCLLVAPLIAVAQDRVPNLPHLDVKGHAERQVQPDRFTITLSVESTNIKPVEARKRVEQHMNEVFAGFKAHHALPESIQATAISIRPDTTYRQDVRVFEGTKVSRTATATFAKLDDLRGFIDGIDANEELQISATEVNRSDVATVREQLRRDAIEDSKRSAKALAAAYDVKLGKVYTVADVAPPTSRDSDGYLSVSVAANTLPVIDLQVGSIKVEQTIYVTYLLDNAP